MSQGGVLAPAKATTTDARGRASVVVVRGQRSKTITTEGTAFWVAARGFDQISMCVEVGFERFGLHFGSWRAALIRYNQISVNVEVGLERFGRF